MKCLFAIRLLFVVSSACLCAIITPSLAFSVNVFDYGAKGDGQTDDSQAFLQAWEEVCNCGQVTPTLVIPYGTTFMLQPLKFLGPCKAATIIVKVEGTMMAPSNMEGWKWPNDDEKKEIWVQFSEISGLVIEGGGQIDAQGTPWWKYKGDKASYRPTALHFHRCENLTVTDLTHINSPKNHISINKCNGAYVSNLHIIAPEDSPNTDGIDISESTNIFVLNSTIETGDDCIAINSGTFFINISNVYCGPGHGISVGSLGKNGAYVEVEEIHVKNCTFNGTTNGARIKTWIGGSGFARKITFEDIILINTKNPVIINQQYEDHHSINENGNGEAVAVSDVIYRNITGTSACENAINLSCDLNIGCNGIVLENIEITPYSSGDEVYASCTKANGTSSSCSPILSCLSNSSKLP
ncbi:hypothetical protein Lal_00029467 [Lupinus albus]|uniref:Putative polygalacturonase n=1 Tax=Lupinus albus TaxID=3870 RepID=A0A6A5LUC0_LUPAL|nr:putative polygalacturonase [Lupinus albus]KAF1864309.1 hypothetical protein Lal_00029467 [Lupinus albus]